MLSPRPTTLEMLIEQKMSKKKWLLPLSWANKKLLIIHVKPLLKTKSKVLIKVNKLKLSSLTLLLLRRQNNHNPRLKQRLIHIIPLKLIAYHCLNQCSWYKLVVSHVNVLIVPNCLKPLNNKSINGLYKQFFNNFEHLYKPLKARMKLYSVNMLSNLIYNTVTLLVSHKWWQYVNNNLLKRPNRWMI